MPEVYYILLITFLAFPVIGFLFSTYVFTYKHLKVAKILLVIFVVHNLLFFLGYSFKGDYTDYIIFSLEYLFFCSITFFHFKQNNIYLKIFRVLAGITISLMFIAGLFGILMFIFVSMDYEPDKVFHFESNDKIYETRRYSFGGATLENTKYTFETYREYQYLPFEKKIDKSIFFDTESKVAIGENDLKIVVETIDNRKRILFKDKEGNEFSKLLN